MQLPQLVIFDMAGTTVRDRDNVHAALMHALELGGHPITRDEANSVMGIAKPEAIRQLLTLKSGQAPSEAEVQRLYEGFLAYMLNFYETDPGVEAIPGARETFATLQAAGIRVGLDTGFSRPIADAILRRLGWDAPGVLDVTVTTDEVAQGRPAPDLALEAMRRLGLSDTKLVAKVGDTPVDLGEGTAAGCGWVIGVLSGACTRAELEPHPHTHLLDSVAALPKLLGL